jgi:hypothetical protein
MRDVARTVPKVAGCAIEPKIWLNHRYALGCRIASFVVPEK